MSEPQKPKTRGDSVIGELQMQINIFVTRCAALAADRDEAIGERDAALKHVAELEAEIEKLRSDGKAAADEQIQN